MRTRLAQLEHVARLVTMLRATQRHYEREPSHPLRLEAKALERELDTALFELGALRFDPEGGSASRPRGVA